VQAERELRRRAEAATIVARRERRTIEEAGAASVAHLENVMERTRTTVADDHGYPRRHLKPFFGDVGRSALQRRSAAPAAAG
jgi:hypothetical protein